MLAIGLRINPYEHRCQKASGGKKTAGTLEETPALFIRLLRKGVPKGRSLPLLLYLCAMDSRTRRRTREKKQ
jgi:hypothetical protein